MKHKLLLGGLGHVIFMGLLYQLKLLIIYLILQVHSEINFM